MTPDNCGAKVIGKIESLQALRGFAAFFVCLMHFAMDNDWNVDSSHHKNSYFVARLLGSFGASGVDIFFCLSGFIISHSIITRDYTPSIRNSLTFLIKRAFRIFPAYWIALLGGGASSQILGADFNFLKDNMSLRSIFLMTNKITLLPQAWTLAYEMWFYIGIFLIVSISHKKTFLYSLSIWAVCQASILILNRFNILHITYFTLSNPQIMEFFLGVFASWTFLKTGRYAVPSIISGLVIAIWGSVVCYSRLGHNGSLFDGERFFFFGIPGALIIYGLSSLERLGKFSPPVIACRIGDISYSLYLWHTIIMALSIYFIWVFPLYAHVDISIKIILMMVVSLIVALTSFRCIELPFIKIGESLCKSDALNALRSGRLPNTPTNTSRPH
ncbi:acyltransferase family protein [Acetobacter aceti]|uniref:acyltransferase family protein n=1 Tax=Acetobacter aceti TaxID=435 RepID=UPI0015E06873|nr:acyltransferase [Acetobacter aceti]